jgi:hypothetical protein
VVSSLENKARQKIEEAVQEKKDREQKANAAVWAAVVVSAGSGAVPPMLSHWAFISVNAVLIVALGSIYGHHMTKHPEFIRICSHGKGIVHSSADSRET